MFLREELRQRLAKEYRYASTKIQESPQPPRKLFYFSVIFSEAQRLLNWEWSRDLALIYAVGFHTHSQISAGVQQSVLQALPIDWPVVFDKLALITSDLAAYFEKTENEGSEELCQILSRFAEVAYTVSGNGSYLHEKGLIKLEPST